MRIGIDLMGSDCSPFILFEAIQLAAEEFLSVHFAVFVTQVALDQILLHPFATTSLFKKCVEFQVVSEVIVMNDDPLRAFREKKSSSLVIGLKLLKKRDLDAFVSAGNTGALIAGATLTLPLLPGIKRPALLALLPTEKAPIAVVDVGGNVSCKAPHLLQFAQLGAAYQRCHGGVKRPRLGLLNIGAESKKGTSEIRQAYQLLQHSIYENRFQFIGNVEGREVFQGNVDVLVTDGFTGNILLKAAEGVSSFMLQKFHDSLGFLPLEQRQGLLTTLQRQFDYEEYPGAIILGIDGIVIKCHGKSTGKGLWNGIKGAIKLVQNDFIHHFLNA